MRLALLSLALCSSLAACGDDSSTDTPAVDALEPDASVVGVPGTYTIAGTARFEDRPGNIATDELGTAVAKPARLVKVAVVADADTTMTPLAEGVADETGHFSLSYTATGGDLVHVLLVPVSTDPAHPIRVNKTAATVHGFGGAAFAAGVVTEQDVLVTVASNSAQAFNIFDNLLDVMAVIRDDLGDPTPTPLTAIWRKGNQDGTYYEGNTLHLLGADDDDGFDDTVIRHEAGHFVEDTEGRSDSQGGSHDGTPTDPRLAWSEGFSTYFSMAVGNDPVYIDTATGGGFHYNGDTEKTAAPQPAGNQSQDISEDTVTEVLWDHGDAGASDDDAIAGTHKAVLVVQAAYLKTATLRVGAGVTGVDLVDWLDGWFVANGLTNCTGSKTIVTTDRKFPYDYAGPGGACQ